MSGALPFEVGAMWSIIGVAIAGLLYAVFLSRQILRADAGNQEMQAVSNSIREGAGAYLNRQLRTIVVFIGILTIALYMTAALAGSGWQIAVGRAAAFLMGSLFSLTVGQIGMRMAVIGNVRVASAAQRSFGEALKIAYRSGTITGMLTDGLGLLGGTVIFIIYGKFAPEVLLGFGFGGTLIALFMRVGGGIYTKAADVGADLVGKIEQNIPEDDPRNAAVIADLVGDNVGDCAGMAADIFESYEVTIVAAMILGLAIQPFNLKWILFPLLVRAIGVISSIIGTYYVRAFNEKENAFKSIKRGFNLSAATSIIGFVLIAWFYVHDIRLAIATFAGIMLAIVTNYLTEYFTGTDKAPVKEIAKSSQSGTATLLLSGLASGMESSVWAIIVIAFAILASVLIFHNTPSMILYGVALCGIGQLTLTGNNIAMDAFGPIADNANGIGEMTHMDKKSRQIMADLDAVGNTTKAVTKGIAIGSAVIAAVSLFGAFADTVKVITGAKDFFIDIGNPIVFVGFLIGGAIPFLFSSMTIRAVGRAAYLIVNEVRRQFKIPGLMEGKVKPDYAKAVAMCTTSAQRELLGVGAIAVLSPIIVGFIFKEAALGGFLAGVILVGQLMAVFMANTGGAWDNAKKTIEDGLYGGKGSDAHKASVIGDTVGDPLKDTAGPALNPMIKVINMVSLLIVPLIISYKKWSPLIIIMIVVLLAIVGYAIWYSKRQGTKEENQQ